MCNARFEQDETIHPVAQSMKQDYIHAQCCQALESITQHLRETKPLPIDSLTLLREDRVR